MFWPNCNKYSQLCYVRVYNHSYMSVVPLWPFISHDQYFLIWNLLNICLKLIIFRHSSFRAARFVHQETAAMLCRIRFHGSGRRSEEQGSETGLSQRTCRLYHSHSRGPHRTNIPRGRQNGAHILPFSLLLLRFILCDEGLSGMVARAYNMLTIVVYKHYFVRL